MSSGPFTEAEAIILRAAANLLRVKGDALVRDHDPLATSLGFAGRAAQDAARDIDAAIRALNSAGLLPPESLRV